MRINSLTKIQSLSRPGCGQQKSMAKINGSRRTENQAAGSNEDQSRVQADNTRVDLSRQPKSWRSPWKIQARANQTMAPLQEKNRTVQRPVPDARGPRPAVTDELCRRTNRMSAARPERQKLKTRAKPGKWISVQTGERT
jgi:hypothetical protein